ncbi:MAG: hypothetical protein HYY42_03065 [Chloroflexi bacterium]|nr:hypothetical protein [Chloroflexota bacterium]
MRSGWPSAARTSCATYRASGDTALVERHYRSLVHLLRSELGTQPSRETTELYEKLRGKDARLGPVAPVLVTTR